MASMYNIIWADDETAVYALKKPNGENTALADILERRGIRLLDTARNAKELRDKLAAKISWVDAVIIDANFTAFGEKPKTERVLQGFEASVDILRTLGENGNRIPFILYSARDWGMLQENTEADYLRYFEENDLYFNKDEDTTDDMLTRLIEEVDRVNTPEFQIRNRYSKEFAAAELIPEAPELLMEGLRFEYQSERDYENAQVYFNPARMIIERIVDSLKHMGILPPIYELNAVPSFLKGYNKEFTLLDKTLMPQPLAHSLKYFLDITQDGSHDRSDLRLGVYSYVRDKQNINLYRTILYIAMDVLLWYQEVCQRVPVNIWKANYIHTGVLSTIQAPDHPEREDFVWYVVDNYKLWYQPELKERIGQRIGIKEVEPASELGYFVVKRGNFVYLEDNQ